MTSASITCPGGHPNPAEQKFCGACGVSLAGVCPSGHPNPEGQLYCGECGSPVAGSFAESGSRDVASASDGGKRSEPPEVSSPMSQSAGSASGDSRAEGWYADLGDPATESYWDGTRWRGSRMKSEGVRFATQPPETSPGWGPSPTPQPVTPATVYRPAVSLGPQEKSSGLAVLLTILWPGAGHLYLGLNKKAVPFVVANAIGFVLGLTVYLLPISILIWLVTLFMTVGSVTDETKLVNDAIRRGERIDG